MPHREYGQTPSASTWLLVEEELEEEVREKSFSRNFPAYEQVDYWSFRGFWHDFSTAVASYASAAGTSYEVEQTGNCPVGGLAVFGSRFTGQKSHRTCSGACFCSN